MSFQTANSYTFLVITIIQSTEMNNSIIAETSIDQTYFICLPDFFLFYARFWHREKTVSKSPLYFSCLLQYEEPSQFYRKVGLINRFLNGWIKTYFQINKEFILKNTANYLIYRYDSCSVFCYFLSYHKWVTILKKLQIIMNFVSGTRKWLMKNTIVSVSRGKCLELIIQTLHNISLL